MTDKMKAYIRSWTRPEEARGDGAGGGTGQNRGQRDPFFSSSASSSSYSSSSRSFSADDGCLYRQESRTECGTNPETGRRECSEVERLLRRCGNNAFWEERVAAGRGGGAEGEEWRRVEDAPAAMPALVPPVGLPAGALLPSDAMADALSRMMGDMMGMEPALREVEREMGGLLDPFGRPETLQRPSAPPGSHRHRREQRAAEEYRRWQSVAPGGLFPESRGKKKNGKEGNGVEVI